MKNVINYFYNFFVDKISIVNDNAIVLFNGDTYIFKRYYGDINKTKQIMDILENNNVYYYKVVININNELLTKYNDNDYILIKVTDTDFDVKYNFNFIDTVPNDINIATIWSNKIDYYMQQINKLSFGKELLINTFNYYVGLAENAISIYNKSNDLNENVRYVISHYRIKYPNYNLFFLDPSNMLIDVISRDIAEYIKSSFIYGDMSAIEALNIIHMYNLNNREVNILISRILYPTYYFDIFDDEIISKEEEDTLNKIINKMDEFEQFIKDLIFELRKEYLVFEIDWLKKEL